MLPICGVWWILSPMSATNNDKAKLEFADKILSILNSGGEPDVQFWAGEFGLIEEPALPADWDSVKAS